MVLVDQIAMTSVGHPVWNKGLHGWWTESMRKAHHEAVTGKKRTPEQLAKMSAKLKGRHISFEQRIKLADYRRTKFDYELLIRMYVEERKSAEQIARELGSNGSSVRRALVYLGVPLRSNAEVRALLSGEGHPFFGKKLVNMRKENIGRYKRTEWHRQRAKEYSKGFSAEARRKIAITRATPESKAKVSAIFSMSGNPNWQGGISVEPYSTEFTEYLKESIRSRDNHTCQWCSTPQNGRKLDVHHIDHNKKNCANGNLVSLCFTCHAKTFHNRDYWMIVFRTLLSNRGIV